MHMQMHDVLQENGQQGQCRVVAMNAALVSSSACNVHGHLPPAPFGHCSCALRVHARRISWINCNRTERRRQDRVNSPHAAGRLRSVGVQGSRGVRHGRHQLQVMLPLVCCQPLYDWCAVPLGQHSTARRACSHRHAELRSRRNHGTSPPPYSAWPRICQRSRNRVQLLDGKIATSEITTAIARRAEPQRP